MRTPGGAFLPEDLRSKIRERIVESDDDPRLSNDFESEGQKGFFAFGARVAIQWEQVARLQQLHIVASARVCSGATAVANDDSGKPDLKRKGQSVSCGDRLLAATHQPATQGQLVYYFQAVDRFKHRQKRDVHMEALKFVNLSKSAGLMGMLGVYIGMRVRLTKKVLAPELVQDATGEMVGIAFHPQEKFSGGQSSSNLRPADEHPCWQVGHVKWAYCLLITLTGTLVASFTE